MIRQNAARYILLLLAAFLLVGGEVGAQMRLPLGQQETQEAAEPEQQEEEVKRSSPAEASEGTSIDAAVEPRKAANRAEGWQEELEDLAERLQRGEIEEEALLRLRDRVQEIAQGARSLEGRLEPQLRQVQARLSQLGPPPADGAPAESAELSERRRAEQTNLSRTDTALKAMRLVALRAEQLALDITATRRDRMTERLTARGPSALDPGLWQEVAEDGAAGVRALGALVSKEWAGRGREWPVETLAALSAVLLVLGGGGILLRRLGRRFGVSRSDLEAADPTVSRRLLRAALVAISGGLLPALLLFALFLIVRFYGDLDRDLETLLRGVLSGVASAIFVSALARAFFSPASARWRLLEVSDGAARALSGYVSAVGLVLAFSIIMQTLNNALVAAVSLDIARRAVTGFLIALLFGLALRRLALEWQDGEAADTEREPHPLSVILRVILSVTIAVIVVALLLGYVSLGSFLAAQMVFGVTVIAILWLLLGVTDDAITTLVRPGRSVGQAIQGGFGLSSGGVRQIAVLTSGVLRLALIVLAILLILLPWGFEAERWTAWLRAAFFGFEVGEVRISFASILTALLLVALGVAATRGIQSWLANRYLPNTRLDVGMRNSIRTMSGYLGIIATAVFAFSYVGLDLENVALLAGALSVGIGFGLQSIVNNFVSGLILLAERPIKEGDWIVVGPEHGYVRRISIRATEIETFDRGTVIVPNSDLITGTVKNWTHSSMIGRVDVAVRVAYGSSAQRVRDVILEVAQQNSSILYYPEPAVLFMDFGDHGLVFKLFAYIADINNVYDVGSELRFEIERRFTEEDIHIPVPQQDLTIKNAEMLAAAFAAAQGERGRKGSAGEDGAT